MRSPRLNYSYDGGEILMFVKYRNLWVLVFIKLSKLLGKYFNLFIVLNSS